MAIRVQVNPKSGVCLSIKLMNLEILDIDTNKLNEEGKKLKESIKFFNAN